MSAKPLSAERRKPQAKIIAIDIAVQNKTVPAINKQTSLDHSASNTTMKPSAPKPNATQPKQPSAAAAQRWKLNKPRTVNSDEMKRNKAKETKKSVTVLHEKQDAVSMTSNSGNYKEKKTKRSRKPFENLRRRPGGSWKNLRG